MARRSNLREFIQVIGTTTTSACHSSSPLAMDFIYQIQVLGPQVCAERQRAVAVTFTVTNVGRMAGAAVPQVYVGAGPAIDGVQQAVRSLRGFDRVYLEPGQAKQVTIALDQRSFQYWSEPRQQWVTNYGNRTIFVGEADALSSLPLSDSIRLVEPNR